MTNACNTYGNCICIRVTKKAILVERLDGLKAWIPRTQVESKSEVRGKGDMGTLRLRRGYWVERKLVWQSRPRALVEQDLYTDYKKEDNPALTAINMQKSATGTHGHRLRRRRK